MIGCANDRIGSFVSGVSPVVGQKKRPIKSKKKLRFCIVYKKAVRCLIRAISAVSLITKITPLFELQAL